MIFSAIKSSPSTIVLPHPKVPVPIILVAYKNKIKISIRGTNPDGGSKYNIKRRQRIEQN